MTTLFGTGYVVLGPDYFFGDPVHLHNGEAGFDRTAWMEKSRKQAIEALPKWTEAVTEEYGRALPIVRRQFMDC
jgi:hypothetical protein